MSCIKLIQRKSLVEQNKAGANLTVIGVWLGEAEARAGARAGGRGWSSL
jgi:hypothetical protein